MTFLDENDAYLDCVNDEINATSFSSCNSILCCCFDTNASKDFFRQGWLILEIVRLIGSTTSKSGDFSAISGISSST